MVPPEDRAISKLEGIVPRIPERSPEDFLDLLNQERPICPNPMSADARAAQFSPYAALVGHKEIIADHESTMAEKVNLDQEIIITPDDQVFDFEN